MKKGDKVLISDDGFDWDERTFDHEYDGVYYCESAVSRNVIYKWKYCKPAKQTVDEFTEEWISKERFMCRHGLLTPKGWAETFNQYYQDRKKWENE